MNGHIFRALFIMGAFLVNVGNFALAEFPPIGRTPGERTIRTKSTHFVSTPPGRTDGDEVVTSAINSGPHERFAFYGMAPNYTLIKTASGKFLSAMNGGGISNSSTRFILRAERTQVADDALFKFHSPAPGYEPYTIQTSKSFYLTAIAGGGQSTKAFNTNATQANAWEKFQINQCGALGTEQSYAIVPRATSRPLSAIGGRAKSGISTTDYNPKGARFKFIRQPSRGYYALQLFNSNYYVTAAGGGGLSHGTPYSDTLVTNQTHALGWEMFALMDRGDCNYTIQASNGNYIGVNAARNISTAIPNPKTGANLGYNVFFQLIPFVLQ